MQRDEELRVDWEGIRVSEQEQTTRNRTRESCKAIWIKKTKKNLQILSVAWP